MSQLGLFIAPPRAANRLSPRERFEAFHHENPGVYGELVRLAREAKSKGAAKLGIRALWERMRWFYRFEVKDPSQQLWRMNDHYTSFYARLIAQQERDLAGFFELRGDE